LSFQRIAIVGHGLIGGSIALALRARTPDVEVVTIDRNDLLQDAADADLIVLSAPVRANVDNLRALDGRIRPTALITDTGSTKAAILAAAGGLRFIGGHPIAGLAASGRDAAQADLFVGQRWILTPATGASGDDLAALQQFVASLGAIPTLMTGTDHDRLFAYVSHLPQMTISALMHVIGQSIGRDGLAFAGPGLRDSSRLAASPPDIWRDIAADNHANLTTAIDTLIAALQTLRNDISGEDLTEIFESARRSRAALELPDHR
jgi:prephenate dehydrogenase